jgi:type IX secretion system PorP/SprF family membrane protein
MQLTTGFRNLKLVDEINYYTTMFQFQSPINYKLNRIVSGHIAATMLDDRMSNTGFISTTGAALAYAQPVQITSKSILSLGLQYFYYQKKFDLNGYTTGSQWNLQTGYNPNLPIAESINNRKVTSYSISGGLFWQLLDNAGETKAYIGASAFNLNRPEEGFTSKKQKTDYRYSLIGSCRIVDNGNVRLSPEIMYFREGKQNFLNSGIKLGMHTTGTNSYLPFKNGFVYILTKYLSNQSLMFGTWLEQPHYEFGISYDYSVGKVLPGVSNALEVFLVFKFGKNKQKVERPVAKDYYIGQVRDFFEKKEQDTASSIASKPSIEKENQAERKPVSLALKRDFKFGFNDATLNEESKTYLDELISLMERNKRMVLEIIGHTDDVGTEEGNRIISVKRAQVVADYMIAKGINAERIKVTGKMDKEPLFPNNSAENRSKNRRVEFILTE